MKKVGFTGQRRQIGFTLIEIMVVVAIIALLGVAVVPRVIDRYQQVQQEKALSDIRSIESVLKLYRLDNFKYPLQSEGLEALLAAPTGARNWRGPYIDSTSIDPWGNEYRYANPGTRGKDVDIFTYGADNQEGGEGIDKDLGNWSAEP